MDKTIPRICHFSAQIMYVFVWGHLHTKYFLIVTKCKSILTKLTKSPTPYKSTNFVFDMNLSPKTITDYDTFGKNEA